MILNHYYHYYYYYYYYYGVPEMPRRCPGDSCCVSLGREEILSPVYDLNDLLHPQGHEAVDEKSAPFRRPIWWDSGSAAPSEHLCAALRAFAREAAGFAPLRWDCSTEQALHLLVKCPCHHGSRPGPRRDRGGSYPCGLTLDINVPSDDLEAAPAGHYNPQDAAPLVG